MWSPMETYKVPIILPMNPKVNGSLYTWDKNTKIIITRLNNIRIKNKRKLGERLKRDTLRFTSLDIMCANWFLGPLSAKKDPTIKPQPRVNEIANFWGTSTISGRNNKNASKMKKKPVARNIQKYIMALGEGRLTLLAADWRFPGSSETPFVTLQKQSNNKSVNLLKLKTLDIKNLCEFVHTENAGEFFISGSNGRFEIEFERRWWSIFGRYGGSVGIPFG